MILETTEEILNRDLRSIFWMVRKKPAWLTLLTEAGLPKDDLEQFEKWDDEFLSREDREQERWHKQDAAKRVREFKRSLRPQKTGIELAENEIEEAKAFPLWLLLNKKSGQKVCCLWHPDKNPSMQLYEIKAHCFVCQKTADCIDWIMERDGKSFREAVKFINNL